MIYLVRLLFPHLEPLYLTAVIIFFLFCIMLARVSLYTCSVCVREREISACTRLMIYAFVCGGGRQIP